MQQSQVFYSEKQRFRQWWIWLPVLVSSAIFLWALVQQVALGVLLGGNPAPDYVLVIFGLIFGAGFPLLMYRMGLDIEVREYGVSIRFWPFHRRWVEFGFDRIQKADAITYRPLRDYGGWGIRYGTKGKAYNVSGNKGVLLTLSEGKNVLIGSKNHEALESAINEQLS